MILAFYSAVKLEMNGAHHTAAYLDECKHDWVFALFEKERFTQFFLQKRVKK